MSSQSTSPSSLCENEAVDPLYAELGRRVREQRLRAGFSQQQLANRVDLGRTSITNIERGGQRISIDQLYRLAAALGSEPADLLPDPASAELPARLTQVLREDPDLVGWATAVLAHTDVPHHSND
jgi:transcriptional regulator with XRE-family HTH domain